MKQKLLFFVLFTCTILKINAQNITVENGALKFSSIEVYEQFAENTMDRKEIAEYGTKISPYEVTTTEDSDDTNDLYPDFLKSIMNVDRIFAIGNFLIKMDLENNRALVIAALDPDAVGSLNNFDGTNQDVLVFTDEEDYAADVLETITNSKITIAEYNKTKVEENAFRRCRGADRENVKSQPVEIWGYTKNPKINCPTQVIRTGMDNEILYQKAIFYFSLSSKIKSKQACEVGSNWILVPRYTARIAITDGFAKFVKVSACRNEVQHSYNDAPGYVGTVRNWRPYEGLRALNKFYMQVTFGIQHDGLPSFPLFLTSPYIINSGY